MTQTTGLVPARFLTIVAHLIISIVLFLSREENVKACLPLQYTQDEYNAKDQALMIGIAVSFGLFFIELSGFFGGLSMFMHTASLLSTAAHAAGAISLSYFLFDTWDCNSFWYIFGFTSAFPAVMEIIVMIGVLRFNKGL